MADFTEDFTYDFDAEGDIVSPPPVVIIGKTHHLMLVPPSRNARRIVRKVMAAPLRGRPVVRAPKRKQDIINTL